MRPGQGTPPGAVPVPKTLTAPFFFFYPPPSSPDNVPCHFVAAFGAGFCATVVASPVDVVKTRYMNAGPGQYRNVPSCLLALLMQDGLAGLYKG